MSYRFKQLYILVAWSPIINSVLFRPVCPNVNRDIILSSAIRFPSTESLKVVYAQGMSGNNMG